MIDDEHMPLLASALRVHPTLTTLDLSNNNITSGFDCLFEVLFPHPPEAQFLSEPWASAEHHCSSVLVALNLSGNAYPEVYQPLYAHWSAHRSHFHPPSSSPAVRCSVGCAPLQSLGAPAQGDQLHALSALLRLTQSGSGLQCATEAWTYISIEPAEMPRSGLTGWGLQTLDLSRSTECKEFRPLIDALSVNRSITSLTLHDLPHFSDANIAHLFQMMRGRSVAGTECLVRVSIVGCDARNAAVNALCDYLLDRIVDAGAGASPIAAEQEEVDEEDMPVMSARPRARYPPLHSPDSPPPPIELVRSDARRRSPQSPVRITPSDLAASIATPTSATYALRPFDSPDPHLSTAQTAPPVSAVSSLAASTSSASFTPVSAACSSSAASAVSASSTLSISAPPAPTAFRRARAEQLHLQLSLPYFSSTGAWERLSTTFQTIVKRQCQNHPSYPAHLTQARVFRRQLQISKPLGMLCHVLHDPPVCALSALCGACDVCCVARFLDSRRTVMHFNRCAARRVAGNWACVAVLSAFVRANASHPFVFSILPLLREITHLTGLLEPVSDKD
jgi:hypothetical protein